MGIRATDALLPVIADDFRVSVAAAGITVAAFTLPYGLMQIVFGPLGDRFGKMRVIGLALAANSTAQETSKSSSADPGKLSGEWKYVEGTRAGVPASDENMESDVTISAKEFTLSAAGNTFVMSYTLNASTDPMQIDMEITEGPAPDRAAWSAPADRPISINVDTSGEILCLGSS